MKIIIIEDEHITAEDLEATILKVNSKAQIIQILGSVKEALNYFRDNQNHIDLIFSDIQLGDGSSFEIFENIEIKCPIIFCTAYDQYALKAFEMNGIHYLLKPFDTESVKIALEKYETLKENLSGSVKAVSMASQESDSITNLKTVIELLQKEELLKKGEAPKSILVYHKDKILPIRLEDVALFHIESNTTKLITFRNNSYQVNKPMEELESICSNSFFRVNRQFLINRDAIIDTAQYFKRKLVVNLNVNVPEKVIVSKAKAPTFLNWLLYT